MSTTPYIVFFPVKDFCLIAPILSTGSTFLVILYCIIKKKYKQPLGSMILLISIADCHFCLTKLIFSMNPHWYSEINCKIFDAINHFGLISSVVWGAAFGHALCHVVRTQMIEILEKKIKIYITLAVVVPLFFSSTIFVVDYISFKPETGECVHLIQTWYNIGYLFLALIPIAGSCFLSIYWYCTVYKELKGLQVEGNTLTLIAYPGIIILCWAPVLCTCVAVMWYSNKVPTEMNLLLNIFDSLGQLQGFFDAVIYGGGVHKLCSCLNRKRNSTVSEVLLESNRGDESVFSGTKNGSSDESIQLFTDQSGILKKRTFS